jgi:hypothetical protein
MNVVGNKKRLEWVGYNVLCIEDEVFYFCKKVCLCGFRLLEVYEDVFNI